MSTLNFWGWQNNWGGGGNCPPPLFLRPCFTSADAIAHLPGTPQRSGKTSIFVVIGFDPLYFADLKYTLFRSVSLVVKDMQHYTDIRIQDTIPFSCAGSYQRPS